MMTTTSFSVVALAAIAYLSGNALALPATGSRMSSVVSGSAPGFAAGVVGGGDATPATPSDAAQLKAWLEDSTPRVITISKTYDFTGSEGVCNNCAGCIPSSYKCSPASAGQLAIDLPGQTWCDGLPSTTVSYDKAAITGINVASHKTLVGQGAYAGIKGKGLRITGGAQNIIVQNIAITQLNPSLIWGGDAFTIDGSDLVWLDHCYFNAIGRQMFVTGYDNSGRVTVSNNEFDGQTSTSASCDGRHYWSVLGYGKGDLVTFTQNYIHHTSGRSPKTEYNDLWHSVSNYWYSNTGHAFDVGANSSALIEGNQFDDVATTSLQDPQPGQIFAPTAANANACQQYLGRACQVNGYYQSPAIDGTATGFLANFNGRTVAPAMPAASVKAYVKRNAGVGNV